MNSQTLSNLSDVQISKAAEEQLIEAYDNGYESREGDACPYVKGTALATLWYVGHEHKVCEAIATPRVVPHRGRIGDSKPVCASVVYDGAKA